MSIKHSLLAGVAGALLAGGAMAAEPLTLTDTQLDEVSAGLFVVGGLALVGPFQSLGAQSLTFTDLSQSATSEWFKGTATGVENLYEAQAAAGLQATVLSNQPAGTLFTSGGSLAVSFSLTQP